MNNVHEDAPVVFETRWALSYLRGPLTRAQIKTLMDARRGAGGSAPATAPTAATASASATTRRPSAPVAPVPAAPASAPPARGKATRPAVPVAEPAPTEAASGCGQAPLLPPDVPQHFAPAHGAAARRVEPSTTGRCWWAPPRYGSAIRRTGST